VLGDSDEVAVGDPVVAVGSPLGLDGTVTAGIVSALQRPVTAGGQGEIAFISAVQTDAAINPGNSGGPLVDGSGRVIGINTAIASTSAGEGNIGLGFAIPINQARRTVEQIIETGVARYPVVGVQLAFQGGSRGATLVAVPEGPARDAGLREGDVVTEVDGRPVDSDDAFVVAIRTREPGEVVELTYRRDGQTGTVEVELGSAEG
jgi:putative serine protease PepD